MLRYRYKRKEEVVLQMISRQRGYVSQGQLELESQKGDTEVDWHARIGYNGNYVYTKFSRRDSEFLV